MNRSDQPGTLPGGGRFTFREIAEGAVERPKFWRDLRQEFNELGWTHDPRGGLHAIYQEQITEDRARELSEVAHALLCPRVRGRKQIREFPRFREWVKRAPRSQADCCLYRAVLRGLAEVVVENRQGGHTSRPSRRRKLALYVTISDPPDAGRVPYSGRHS
jgi:hypothetical protein